MTDTCAVACPTACLPLPADRMSAGGYSSRHPLGAHRAYRQPRTRLHTRDAASPRLLLTRDLYASRASRRCKGARCTRRMLAEAVMRTIEEKVGVEAWEALSTEERNSKYKVSRPPVSTASMLTHARSSHAGSSHA
eukprot:7113878-Prymnesium_polylepis.1